MGIFKIQPEVIAIHVPKTAGSTFHAVMKEAYGFGLKHIQEQEDLHVWNNGLEYRSNKPFVKAVYGHIEAHPNWLDFYPKAKLITWVRDPVERVISTYYHWMKAGVKQDKRQREFLSKKPDLMEFVESDEFLPTIRAYSVFLGRIPPEKYQFIGRTEHFNEDLLKLESVLGRSLNKQVESRNVNPRKLGVSSSEKERIRTRIPEEYELYHKLLEKTY